MNDDALTFHCSSEDETRRAGIEIAKALPPDAIVNLTGDLGAGKTLLVRAMATALGADPLEVTSPSFAILHEYPRTGDGPIIHIDGYRLSDDAHEWAVIGIPDLLRSPGIKFIEWPKRDFARLTDSTIDIEIRVNPDESRTIVVR